MTIAACSQPVMRGPGGKSIARGPQSTAARNFADRRVRLARALELRHVAAVELHVRAPPAAPAPRAS